MSSSSSCSVIASTDTDVAVDLTRSRDLPPKGFQTIVDPKQSAEDRRIHEQNVAGAFSFRRHPENDIEFCISGVGKRMRSGHINGLFRQHMNAAGVFRSH